MPLYQSLEQALADKGLRTSLLAPYYGQTKSNTQITKQEQEQPKQQVVKLPCTATTTAQGDEIAKLNDVDNKIALDPMEA